MHGRFCCEFNFLSSFFRFVQLESLLGLCTALGFVFTLLVKNKLLKRVQLSSFTGGYAISFPTGAARGSKGAMLPHSNL